MLLTSSELSELSNKLDKERVSSTGPGNGKYCTQMLPNRLEKKGKIPKEWIGKTHPKAGAIVTDEEGNAAVEVPGGYHGRAFLAIDPESGEVSCTKCLELPPYEA